MDRISFAALASPLVSQYSMGSIFPAVPRFSASNWRGFLFDLMGDGDSRTAEDNKKSLAVFIDAQNCYRRCRYEFDFEDKAPLHGQTDPVKLSRLLARLIGKETLVLAHVGVYTGRPSAKRNPKQHSAHMRQVAAWNRRYGKLVKLHHRPLQYLRGQPPREKGIDVLLAIDLVTAALRRKFDRVVVFSSDSDLLPALELSVEQRGPEFIEVAGWRGSSSSARILRLPGVRRHILDRAAYDRVADLTDYSISSRMRRQRSKPGRRGL